MNPSEALRGRRAVVTGASSGIGADYARRLGGHGAHLVIAARRRDRLDAVAEEIRAAHGVEVDVVAVDLAADDGPETLFDVATRDARPVHVLVNNAGLGVYGGFVEQPLARHRATLRVNAVALMELSHHFAVHMLAHGEPAWIHNVGSLAAYQGAPGFAAYNGTKAFVRSFAETLAYELRATNVGVSCTHPGGTYTEFMDTAGQRLTKSAHAVMMTSDEVARRGIDAMLRARPAHVPGVLNKLGAWLPRFFPARFSLWSADRVMRRAVDAVDAGDGDSGV